MKDEKLELPEVQYRFTADCFRCGERINKFDMMFADKVELDTGLEYSHHACREKRKRKGKKEI